MLDPVPFLLTVEACQNEPITCCIFPPSFTPLIDATTATPYKLASHVRVAIEWTKSKRDLNPTTANIHYAWNEHDEGGWLQPTLGADGKPDDSRVKVLR